VGVDGLINYWGERTNEWMGCCDCWWVERCTNEWVHDFFVWMDIIMCLHCCSKCDVLNLIMFQFLKLFGVRFT